MDITPSEMIQHTIEMHAHEDRMRLSKAQEMANLAEATRTKSKATYRYSLLMYIREVIEQRASEGLNDATFFSRTMPWSTAELEAIKPFLDNDGFVTKFEIEYDKKYQGGGLQMMQSTFENVATNNRILSVSW